MKAVLTSLLFKKTVLTQLIYNVVLFSGIQHSDSVMDLCIYSLPYFPLEAFTRY